MKHLFFIALLLAELAAAQVYKCEGPNGPVYSDQECEPGAAKVTLSESSGLGGQITNATRADLAQKKAQRQRDYYQNRIDERRDNDFAAIDAQIADLNRQKSRANNNLAGATYGAGIDAQIAALRASRSQVNDSYRQRTIKAETDVN